MTNVVKNSELTEEVKEKLEKYLIGREAYYIGTLDKWMFFENNRPDNPTARFWVHTNGSQLKKHIKRILGYDLSISDIEEFADTVHRSFNRVTSSKIGTVLDDTLNKAEIEYKYWILNDKQYFQEQSECIEELDIFFDSLSGLKEENKKHIYEWTIFKIFNPGKCTTLPILNIYGQGGSGKSLFSNKFLATVFHGHEAIVDADMKSVGGFNGEFDGATIGVFDESGSDRVNTEGIKKLSGSEYLMIERKGIDKIKIENLINFLMFTNDPNASVKLDRQLGVNRRYSIVHAGKTLQEVIKIKKGLTEPKEIKNYLDKIVKALTDRTKVIKHIKWLEENYLTENTPTALHEADFQELQQNTRNGTELVCDFVFSKDAGNNYMAKQDLIRLCMQRFKDDSGKNANKKTIQIQLDAWMNNNDFTLKNIRIHNKQMWSFVSNTTETRRFNTKGFQLNEYGYYPRTLMDAISDFQG